MLQGVTNIKKNCLLIHFLCNLVFEYSLSRAKLLKKMLLLIIFNLILSRLSATFYKLERLARVQLNHFLHNVINLRDLIPSASVIRITYSSMPFATTKDKSRQMSVTHAKYKQKRRQGINEIMVHNEVHEKVKILYTHSTWLHVRSFACLNYLGFEIVLGQSFQV